MNAITDMHKKIHMFENKKELLEYKLEYRNVPMWPLVRVAVMISCIDQPEGLHSERSAGAARRHLIQELTIRNPFFTFPKKVIYAGFSNRYMICHGKNLVYDERTMPYLKMSPQANMLISVAEEKEFKYAYRNWKSDYVIHLLAAGGKEENKQDAATARRFIQYLKKEFPLQIPEAQYKIIFDTLMGYSRLLEGYVKTWKLYLQIVKPRLVIQCEGSYLGLSQVALKLACNARRIPTAEIQHAAECINSHAHYWGKQIINSEDCKKIFPDYFLTYGAYWNKEVSLPCKKVVIGTHRKYHSNMKKRNHNILVCLVTNYNEYVDLLTYIVRSSQPQSKIYLRLHPHENTKDNRAIFEQFVESGKVEFANVYNLEYYLGRCTYVVSCASTVVYEALTCGNIVFVPRDKLFDAYNMETIEDRIYAFQTLEEFKKIWNSRTELELKAYDDFYNMNYQKLYKAFLQKMIAEKKTERHEQLF